MKVYKSKPDEYGWYLVIHKLKSGELKLMNKRIDGKCKENWSSIIIFRKGCLELLKKVINDGSHKEECGEEGGKE